MFRFDESDPHFLIVYFGSDHATPDDYRALGARWITRLEQQQRFGIIFANEPGDEGEEEHEHDDEAHRQYEAENNRLINDFRREYGAQTALYNTGYARVGSEAMKAQYFPTDEAWAKAQEDNDRFARYSWGIPGGLFTSMDAAKAWLLSLEAAPGDAQAAQPPEAAAPVRQRVGLFYGSSTGVTEYIAEEIVAAWAKTGQGHLTAINIGTLKRLDALLDYDCLILGIPTWNIGQLQDDWEILLPQLDALDFTGRKVALFGVGDQYGYPDNFLDAVGILGRKLVEQGAELVGWWNDGKYEFSESLAFVDGKFMGLGIDDDNQSKLNDERITGWLEQIITEFALRQPAAS